MVRQITKNGLSRSHDVSPSSPDQRLDGERYRATAQRSFYLAVAVQGIFITSERSIQHNAFKRCLKLRSSDKIHNAASLLCRRRSPHKEERSRSFLRKKASSTTPSPCSGGLASNLITCNASASAPFSTTIPCPPDTRTSSAKRTAVQG